MQQGLFAQLVVVPLFSEHRILTQVAGHKVATIKILPPLVISDADLDEFVESLRETVAGASRMPRALTKFALSAVGAGR
jgi:4-aminobutyrate aminotransferase-like enzyme